MATLAISSIGPNQLAAQETPSVIPETVEFNRDVRPILSDKCVFCHGTDKNKRQAELRLDTEAGLQQKAGDTQVVVPGQPEHSELYRRITTTDDEQLMPPAESGKALTETEKAILHRWIEQGGRFEGHWAFLPIQKTPAPAASASEVSSHIDHFIRESQSVHGLEMSPESDRITLIRRLSFDLTGLPPKESEVADFVNDTSPNAYEKLVDRLLASPHYGERFAIWWLDLVRYADSVGYHGDQEVSVSPFRQYVIDSLNANKPFDEFTVEQLAGDLLPTPSREQRIASGYNRLGMMSAEGGVQDKEYLAKYIAERVRNASGTWLGITLGCSECHDHKFDPFTTRDFYRFEAFFADIKERGLYSGANSDGNWGPFIKVPTADQERRLAEYDRQIVDVKKVLETSTPELLTAQAEWESTQVQWTSLKPDSITSKEGVTLTLQDDGSILASGTNPATDTYTFETKSLPSAVTALRIEVLPHDSFPQKGPGRAGNGNFVLSEFIVRVVNAAGEERLIPLQNATATYEQTGAAGGNPYGKWAVAAAIDKDEKGKTWGWAIMEQAGRPQTAVFEIQDDLTLADGEKLQIVLDQNLDNPQHTIGLFRLSAATASRPIRATDAPPANLAGILATPAEQRSDAQKAELSAFYQTIAPALEPARVQLAELEKSRASLDSQIVSTLVTEAVSPRMVRVLPRGNWMDESGEEVTPAFPVSLAGEPTSDRRLNRLDLAQWIIAKDNPLTSRVTMNRIWKLCFGAGISRKLDDLGAQGEWPSHPELLDYLAAEFIQSGWNLKHMVKGIVMSQTYRQSSLSPASLRETDPYNRWLARQGRFRLDAEFVRDNALAVSGLLVEEIGGTSVRPYQPAGYWAHLNFPTREWQNGSGKELYRRGLYTHWQRQYLHPSLLAFDAPSREECTADRSRSNTPLQSLVLLNDPSYVEAARAFAELILKSETPATSDRVHFAFQRALSRNATPDESAVLESLLNRHLAEYQAEPEAAKNLLSVGSRPLPDGIDLPTLAAWTSVARTILNLHEVITRN
ncbi:MAG: PSD1 domain-containing protein [Planctomyces sp.]|nr:PSD1 domain-containing protein [Planctomyces sp.]